MTADTVPFTAADVLRILREVAGADERLGPEGQDSGDVPLNELGYDSLALLELAARIEKLYPVQIPDSDLKDEMTPRQIVAYVNARRTEARA